MGGLGIPTRGRNRKGFGSVLIRNAGQLLGDFIHGLLVGDFLPTVFTPRTHPLQWLRDAVWMIVDQRHRRALVANIARQRRIVVGDNSGNFAFFCLGAKLAADVTYCAYGILGFF